MSKAVELAIKIGADVDDATRGFDVAGDAARAFADDVEQASRTADAAGDRMGSVADSADELGSKTSQAAGGLGDLGGALSAMPGPLGAFGSGMEAAAAPVQGITGAMDLANLALSSNVVQNARSRAATIASSIATRASAAAARVAAAGQWALNAAMAANPIGLVIIALVALVAIVVVAYKKSETFRNIVQAAMRAAREAVGWVVDKFNLLVGFVRDKAPAAFEKLKSSATGAVSWITDKLGGAFDVITKPIQAVIDLIQHLIDKISSIHLPKLDLPDLPDLNPFGKSSVLSLPSLGRATISATATETPTVDARTYVTVQVDGATLVDETNLANLLTGVLDRQAQRLGDPAAFTGLLA